MTSTHDHDFRQFQGAFDTAMQPDAAFAERLQQRMAKEGPVSNASSRPTVLASPSREQQEIARPRRSHPLFIAVAVLAVFAIAFAGVLQLAPQVLEPQYASQPLATLSEGSDSTPAPDVQLNAERLPGLGNFSIEAMDGKVLYGHAFDADSPGDTTPAFLAYDVEAGEILWQTESAGVAQVTVDGHRLFGTRVRTTDTTQWVRGVPPMDLVALDASTGEELWVKPFPDDPSPSEWGPILVIGDHLLHIGATQAMAYEVETGEVIWSAELEPIESSYMVGSFESPVALEWQGNLVIVNSNGDVLILNPVDGTMLEKSSIPIVESAERYYNTRLFATPDGIAVTQDRITQSGPELHVLVFIPDTGETVSEISVPGQINTFIYEDGTIVLMMSTWESNPWYLRLIGREGHSLAGITWLDANDGSEILRTNPVRLPMIATQGLVTDGEYACYMANEYVCFDRNGTRYLTGVDDNVVQARLDGNILYLATEGGDGVLRVELP